MSLKWHAQSTQNKNFSYLSNISRKTRGMKLIFSLQINTKVFHKLISSLLVCIAWHVQNTQNNKFANLSNILRKVWRMKLIFSPADKHQRFLQINAFILGVCGQACPNYPKWQVCYFFAISSERCGW